MTDGNETSGRVTGELKDTDPIVVGDKYEIYRKTDDGGEEKIPGAFSVGGVQRITVGEWKKKLASEHFMGLDYAADDLRLVHIGKPTAKEQALRSAMLPPLEPTK